MDRIDRIPVVPQFEMQMRSGSHFTGISCNGNGFTGFYQVAFVFQQYGIVLVHRNKVTGMLYGNNITRFQCPSRKNNRSVQHRLYRIVVGCYNVNTKMFLQRGKLGCNDPVERLEEILPENFPVFSISFAARKKIETGLVFKSDPQQAVLFRPAVHNGVVVFGAHRGLGGFRNRLFVFDDALDVLNVKILLFGIRQKRISQQVQMIQFFFLLNVGIPRNVLFQRCVRNNEKSERNKSYPHTQQKHNNLYAADAEAEAFFKSRFLEEHQVILVTQLPVPFFFLGLCFHKE